MFRLIWQLVFRLVVVNRWVISFLILIWFECGMMMMWVGFLWFDLLCRLVIIGSFLVCICLVICFSILELDIWCGRVWMMMLLFLMWYIVCMCIELWLVLQIFCRLVCGVMILVLVGKFGFGMCLYNLVIVVFGWLSRCMQVDVIFCRLCGGMLVVMFIVMLVVLLSSRLGRWVGSMVGLLRVLLKFGIQFMVFWFSLLSSILEQCDRCVLV